MSRILRRKACVAAVVLVVGAATVSVTHQEPAGARRAPVSAYGSIQCRKFPVSNARFDPPPLLGRAGPGVLRYQGRFEGCTGTGWMGRGGPPAAPDGITGGRVRGTMSLASIDCDAPAGGAGTATVHWTGSERYVDTQVTFASGDFNIDGFATYNATVSGSFGGSSAFFEMVFDGNPYVSCMPRIKGQPDTGGLRRATFSNWVSGHIGIGEGVNFAN